MDLCLFASKRDLKFLRSQSSYPLSQGQELNMPFLAVSDQMVVLSSKIVLFDYNKLDYMRNAYRSCDLVVGLQAFYTHFDLYCWNFGISSISCSCAFVRFSCIQSSSELRVCLALQFSLALSGSYDTRQNLNV